MIFIVARDNEVAQVLDEDDRCKAYESGDLCGGCGLCMLMQASHYGYEIAAVTSERGRVLLDREMECSSDIDLDPAVQALIGPIQPG